MPDPIENHELDQLLGFHAHLPADDFTLNVMQRVQRERRRRRVILTICGLLGGAFGLVGAVLLSEPIARLFMGLPLIGTVQATLVVVAAAALYVWMMDEDFTLKA